MAAGLADVDGEVEAITVRCWCQCRKSVIAAVLTLMTTSFVLLISQGWRSSLIESAEGPRGHCTGTIRSQDQVYHFVAQLVLRQMHPSL